MRRNKRENAVQFPLPRETEKQRDKRLERLQRLGEVTYGVFYRGIVNPRKPDPLPYDKRPNRDVAG